MTEVMHNVKSDLNVWPSNISNVSSKANASNLEKKPQFWHKTFGTRSRTSSHIYHYSVC